MYNVMMRTAYPNELYHSGVKGQKWGQRRYQNPDGTLTAEGKARYRNAKKKRYNLETEASRAASVYVDRARRLEKQTAKYNKIKERGEDTTKQTAKLDNAKKAEKYWKQHSSEARKELENHVNNMTKEYKNKKIADIPYASTKYGKQVAGNVLTTKNYASAVLTAAVATAITLPTTGRVVVAVPSKRGVLAGYANKMERQQGIKSPYIGSPKALKRDKR